MMKNSYVFIVENHNFSFFGNLFLVSNYNNKYSMNSVTFEGQIHFDL